MKTGILFAIETFLASDKNKRREEKIGWWYRPQANGTNMKNTAEAAVVMVSPEFFLYNQLPPKPSPDTENNMDSTTLLTTELREFLLSHFSPTSI